MIRVVFGWLGGCDLRNVSLLMKKKVIKSKNMWTMQCIHGVEELM